MKIEKISDNQIKFIFSHDDLARRNLQLRELAYGSPKAQRLFQEIMESAFNEYGFQTSPESPLVIEAIPLGQDGMMVMVTKITNQGDLQGTALPSIFSNLGISQGFMQNAAQTAPNQGSMPADKAPFDFAGSLMQQRPIDQNYAIFAFANLDQAALAAARISHEYIKGNALYKYDSKYFLTIDNSGERKLPQACQNILAEYGDRFSSREMSKIYLQEHGEAIIKEDAINILTAHLS